MEDKQALEEKNMAVIESKNQRMSKDQEVQGRIRGASGGRKIKKQWT